MKVLCFGMSAWNRLSFVFWLAANIAGICGSGFSQEVIRGTKVYGLAPQTFFPGSGYTCHREPNSQAAVVRRVSPGDEELDDIVAVCFAKSDEGRMFLTAQGLEKLRSGKPTEWLFVPNISDLPEFAIDPSMVLNPGELDSADQLWRDGDYSKSFPLQVYAWEKLKQEADWTRPTLRDAYNILYVIGDCAANLGDFDQAETAFIWRAKLAEDHWGFFDRRGGLIPMGILADFYGSIGNYAKELQIRREAFTRHYSVDWDGDIEAQKVGLVDKVDNWERDYQFALKLLKKDLDFAGNEQIEGYRMFLELVRLANQAGSDREAALLNQGLREILEEIDLTDNRETNLHCYSDGLVRLAEYELRVGKPKSGLNLIEKAAGHYGELSESGLWTTEADLILARALLESGKAAQAVTILQKRSSLTRFTNELDVQQMLFKALLDTGDRKAALPVARKLKTLQEERTRAVLAFSSEEQRIRFLDSLQPVMPWLALDEPVEAARATLKYKGLALDASIEESRSQLRFGDPKLAKIQDRLKSARQKAHALNRSLEGDQEGRERDQAIADYRDALSQMDKIESQLARNTRAGGFVQQSLQSDPDELLTQIPDDRIVLDYLVTSRYQGENRSEKVYLGFCYSKGTVKMRVCGRVDQIDRDIATLRQLITRVPRHTVDDDREVEKICRSLYQLLIGDWLDGTGADTVLVSPDGKLNFIPFGALVTESSEPLFKNYLIGYIHSGRNGAIPLRDFTATSALLMGNPDFDKSLLQASHSPVANVESIRKRSRSFEGVSFDPLPGSEKEINLTNGLLVSQGIITSRYLGSRATEARFRNDSKVDLIHIATHGAVLTNPKGLGENDLVIGSMSSGIITFAGANPTIKAWRRGNVFPPENDGILSADEIARLNLSGVQTMIISACETGLGIDQPGEGVMGLRRGIHQAGVEQLVATLWQIADEPTVSVMKEFYGEVFSSAIPAFEAITLAQRRLYEEWKEEYGMLTALYLAAPFIVSVSHPSSGKQFGNSGLTTAPPMKKISLSALPVPKIDTGLKTADVEAFVRKKIAAENTENLSRIAPFYAPLVDYYKEGRISRTEVAGRAEPEIEIVSSESSQQFLLVH